MKIESTLSEEEKEALQKELRRKKRKLRKLKREIKELAETGYTLRWTEQKCGKKSFTAKRAKQEMIKKIVEILQKCNKLEKEAIDLNKRIKDSLC